MATPQIYTTGAFNATGSAGQSASVTFSLNIDSAFYANVPIQVQTPTNVSCGAIVTLYRSTDATNWETTGSVVSVFPLQGSATMRQSFVATQGNYLVSVLTGGGSSASYSVALQSIEICSAYA